MHKLMLIAAIAAALTGCQTRITATKYAEVAYPVQRVVSANGQDQVIVDRYVIASGGWEATARSPLYATEALAGLDLGVSTNGTVYLRLDNYSRDTSTNAVAMVDSMFRGGADLAIAIGEAYTRIAGGGAQAATVTRVARSVYDAFTSAGGDPSQATVTTDNGKIIVSDGSTCTTCTPEGTCSTGKCSL